MFRFLGKTEASDLELEYAARLGIRYPFYASQLPRLLKLRMEKAQDCSCKRCGDLLDKLHKNTHLLEIAHSAEQPGISFWTQTKKDRVPAHFAFQLDKKMKLTAEELTRHDQFIDSLVEVEHDWQRSQRSACTSDDTDDFWMKHFQELKGNITALRNLEETSLEDLRKTVIKSLETAH